MKKSLKLLSVSLGVAALLGLSIGATAFAYTPGEQNAQEIFPGYQGGGVRAGEQICDSVVAEMLGITQQELCDLRLEGLTLAEIAVDQGIDLDELTAALIQAKTDAIQAALDAGTITLEQAEIMLARVADRVEVMLYRIAGTGGQGPMGEGMGNQHRGAKAGSGMLGCDPENPVQSKAGYGKQHRGGNAV